MLLWGGRVINTACLIRNDEIVKRFLRMTKALPKRLLLYVFFSICFFVIFILNAAFAQTNVPDPNQVAPPPGESQPMSESQFKAWLQGNGYPQNLSTTPPPGISPHLNSKQVIVKQKSSVPVAPLTYEQGQQVMLNSIPPNSPVPSPDAAIAFNTMLKKNMPLSPEEVVKLHQQIDMAQRAAAIQPNIPPKPVSTTLIVNLAPGTTPPVIRLAQGYVTSLVFVDSTGSPWPIAAFDIGNPKSVNIQWDGKGNIIFMQAASAYSDGNMVIRLAGLPTPITLELVAGQRVVDYRVDLHVSGIGPNTKVLPIGTPLPESANQLLLGVLDGVAPAGSKFLIVHGADSQAWLLGEKIYLRTRLTVLSPGWMGKMVSPDGMQAYELPKTSSVLVSRYGEPVELKIEGF